MAANAKPGESAIVTGFKVVVAALKAIAPEQEVFCYEIAADFNALWDKVSKPPENAGLIVVVTGEGEDEFLPAALKPWSDIDAWCVAFDAACCKREKSKRSAVFLLDLRKPRQYGVQAVHGRVRRYVLGEHTKSPSALLEALVADIRNFDGGVTYSPPVDGFELVRRQAMLNLEVGDRHDASNTIGALIMQAGLPRSGPIDENPRMKAARILVETLLLREPAGAEVAVAPGTSSQAGGTGSSIALLKPQVVLVDDRHKDGYKDVLERALGTDVEAWTGIFDQECRDGCKNDRQSILGSTIETSPELHAFKADLLFLDLRLWHQGDDKKRKKAFCNYRKIWHSLTEKSGADRKTWTLVDELLRLQDDNRRKLALLPAMLAYLDPGLPIVLFSSTQHRSVTDALRALPNVICDFSKPYIGEADRDAYDPVTVIAGLRVAERRAREMYEVRTVWRQAVGRWSRCDVQVLEWSRTWPALRLSSASDSPLSWLRQEWLPLAQRQEYALAAAAPWIFLSKVFTDTRLQNWVRDERDDADSLKCRQWLKLMSKAHQLPLRERLPACAERTVAVMAALAFVELIATVAKARPDSAV